MPLTQLSYLYILQHIHCTYFVYVQTEFPCMFVKMTQKQAQHVKWLALYQGGIHVTPFSVVIEITSIAKNILNLVYALIMPSTV